jgi:hypothetical protein
MTSDTAAGWLAVAVAVVSFGSFAVPIKWDVVRHADPPVHPFVFQTYKSLWVFATCWLVLLWRPLKFTWLGVVSASFWVPAGAAYVVAVDHVGVGITQAIVSSLVITVSTLWGLLFFHEPVRSGWLAALAFALLAAGVSTMAYFSAPDEPAAPIDHDCTGPDSSRRDDRDSDFRTLPSSGSASKGLSPLLSSDGLPDEAGSSGDVDSGNHKDLRSRSRSLGLAAAAFNGLWGGSVMVPLKIASAQGGGGSSGTTGGVDFVVSFGVGVALVTALGWLLLAARAAASLLAERAASKPAASRAALAAQPGASADAAAQEALLLRRASFAAHSRLPSMRPRLLVLPGALAGLAWSVGNFASMFAVLALGEAVGYSACQAAVMVSGLWGVLYFGEAPRGQLPWMAGALACTAGIALLAHVSR